MHGIGHILKSNGFIFTSKAIAFAIGKDQATIYSALLDKYEYFEREERLDNEKMCYITYNDILLSTCIGEKAQRKHMKELSDLGLIRVKNKGVPQKRYVEVFTPVETLTKIAEFGSIIMQQLKEQGSRSIPKSANREQLKEFIKCAQREQMAQTPENTEDSSSCANTEQVNSADVESTVAPSGSNQKLQDGAERTLSYTKNMNTDILNQSVSDLSIENQEAQTDGQTEYDIAVDVYKRQINFDQMLIDYPTEQAWLHEVLENLLDMHFSDHVKVKGVQKPRALVRGRLARITDEHIRFVKERLDKASRASEGQRINHTGYVQSALFNVSSEFNAYYDDWTKVNGA